MNPIEKNSQSNVPFSQDKPKQEEGKLHISRDDTPPLMEPPKSHPPLVRNIQRVSHAAGLLQPRCLFPED